MANENEDIKDNTENQGAHKHHTWVGDLVEKIEEKIEDLDGDFPLSGGEEPHHTTHHAHSKTGEEIAAEKKEEEHKKNSLQHDLNVDYPLSGGEE